MCVSAVCVVCVVFCCVACLVARLGPLTNSYAAFKKYFFHLQLRSELGLNREMVPMVTHPRCRQQEEEELVEEPSKSVPSGRQFICPHFFVLATT